MNIEWKGGASYKPGRGNYRVEAIVIHVMEGFLYGLDTWVTQQPTAPHLGIGGTSKREIHQYVKLEDTAYHAGGKANGTWDCLGLDDSDCNPYTIGIELEGGYKGAPIDPSTIDEAAWICAILYNDGWLPELIRNRIIGHSQINQVSRQNCPGIDMDWFFSEVVKKYDLITDKKRVEYYKVFGGSKQLNAYKSKDNAFIFWQEDKSRHIIYNNQDITFEFINMDKQISDAQKELSELKTEVANLQSTIQQKEDTITALSDQMSTLREENDTLKITIKNLKDQLEKPKTNDFNLFLFIYEQIKKSVGKSK